MATLVLEVDASQAQKGYDAFALGAKQAAAAATSLATALQRTEQSTHRSTTSATSFGVSIASLQQKSLLAAKGIEDVGKHTEILEGRFRKIVRLGPQILAADLLARTIGFTSAMGALDGVLDKVASQLRRAGNALSDILAPGFREAVAEANRLVDAMNRADKKIVELRAKSRENIIAIAPGREVDVSRFAGTSAEAGALFEVTGAGKAIAALEKKYQENRIFQFNLGVGEADKAERLRKLAEQRYYDEARIVGLMEDKLNLMGRQLYVDELMAKTAREEVESRKSAAEAMRVFLGLRKDADKEFELKRLAGAFDYGRDYREEMAFQAHGGGYHPQKPYEYEPQYRRDYREEMAFQAHGGGYHPPMAQPFGALTGGERVSLGRADLAFGRSEALTKSLTADFYASLDSNLSSALDLATLKTRTLAQTLRSFADDVEQTVLRRFVTGPLANSFGNALGGAFGQSPRQQGE